MAPPTISVLTSHDDNVMAANSTMDDRELIDDLVAANRILTHQGVFDAYGHISARDRRRPDRFWMSRSLPPGQVTANDIIEYDPDSEPVQRGENRLFFERVIHGEVYKARPDVMAVIHDHSPSLIPFCNSDTRLRPMTGNAAFLGEGAPVFDIRASTTKATSISAPCRRRAGWRRR